MDFKDTVIKSYPTGSRFICDPPVMDTDEDIVILVNGYYDYREILEKDGWKKCGEDYPIGGDFCAYRKGEKNYIITEDPEYFLSFVRATKGAKALNLTNKEDRIKLFQAVMECTSGYKGLIDGVLSGKGNPAREQQFVFGEIAPGRIEEELDHLGEIFAIDGAVPVVGDVIEFE